MFLTRSQPLSLQLAAYDAVKKSKGALDKLSKEHKDLSQKAAAVDQTISNLVSDIQKMEAKKANLQHVLEQTAKENAARRNRTETRQIQADQQAEALPSMRMAAESLQMQIKRLEEEVRGNESQRTIYVPMSRSGNLRTKSPLTRCTLVAGRDEAKHDLDHRGEVDPYRAP